jgi:hypothetical protein
MAARRVLRELPCNPPCTAIRVSAAELSTLYFQLLLPLLVVAFVRAAVAARDP